MHTTYASAPTPSFSMRGIDLTPLVTAADTGGAWEAVHQTVAPGGGSPLHTLGADKLFVVLAGRPTLVVGDEEHEAGPGATATVPAGVPHRFENRSPAPAELVVITSGAGHVDFLRGLAALGANGAPDRAAMEAHARAHAVALLG